MSAGKEPRGMLQGWDPLSKGAPQSARRCGYVALGNIREQGAAGYVTGAAPLSKYRQWQGSLTGKGDQADGGSVEGLAAGFEGQLGGVVVL